MSEKMLVTQALDERDLLVKKIADKIAKASFVDTIKPNEEKVYAKRISKEEFALINNMYGEQMNWLVMETTENAEIKSESERVKADWCKEHLVESALDDFGSGYSNTNTLMARRYNYVKLDMSLVRNIHESQSQQTLVSGIIGYCHDNDIKVIAEGIEIQEELDTVVSLGADFGQGYFLGKPQMEI